MVSDDISLTAGEYDVPPYSNKALAKDSGHHFQGAFSQDPVS